MSHPSVLLRAFFGSVLIMLAGCGKSDPAGAATSAKPEIRFAHVHAPDLNSELHFSAVTFAETANGLMPSHHVKVYAQGSLGSEREVYEGMQLGSGAALTVSGTAILNNFDKRIGVMDLPYLWKSYDHVHRVLDGEVGRDLAAGLEKQGLVVLAWVDAWGWRNMLTTKKAVKTPADLAGLKIRTIPSPIYLAALDMMGANPTPMAYGEIYTGLQTGVIDGFEQAPSIVVAERFYEVTKHITLTKHLFAAMVICCSKAQWDRFTPEQQRLLRQAAETTRDRGRAIAEERENTALRTLAEKGMTVHPFDTAAYKPAALKLQDRLAAELGATDLLEKIRRAERE